MRIVTCLIALISFLTSCQKEAGNTTPNQPTNLSGLLASMEYDHTLDSFYYNADKRLTEVKIKTKSNNSVERQLISYSDNKIQQIKIDHTTFTYAYPNAATTRVDLSLFGSGADYRIIFIKENNKLREFIQLSLGTGLPVPYERSVYTYDNKGNIIKEEVFEHNGSQWEKIEDIFITYDDKPNTSSRHEFSAYLLNEDILVNNPLRIEKKSPSGSLLETSVFTYQYDSKNRKIKADIVHTTIGMPSESETIKYNYYN
ncbi:MAG: hypothetical protein ACOVNY_07280 [Chitinophagaceae bacterium]